MGGWLSSTQFFLDFWNLFNFTKPLTHLSNGSEKPGYEVGIMVTLMSGHIYPLRCETERKQ